MSNEPDWSHPKLQNLLGKNARREIELSIINNMLDPEWDGERSSMDFEYEIEDHNKLQDLINKCRNLERVNKEWEALWKPIDELVRPVTPLGESVGDKAVELIRENVLNERQYLPLGWRVTLPEHSTLSLGSNIGLSDGKIVQLISEYHNTHVYKFLQAIADD